MTRTLIRIEKVSFDFKNSCILKDVSFKIQEGDIISILGQSGSGKTTLLRILSSLIKPSSGGLHLENIDENDIGLIFQKHYVFPWLTIEENVAFGMVKKDNVGVTNLIHRIGLLEFRNYYPNKISGGMSQRVAIARSLILKPKLLLMDEPFSDIDFINKRILYGLIKDLNINNKVTFLIVTHDIQEAVRISNKVLLLTERPATIKHVFNKSEHRDENELIGIITQRLYESATL